MVDLADAPDGFKWKFAKGNEDVVLKTVGEDKKETFDVMSLKDAILKTKTVAIYKANEFTPGVPPSKIEHTKVQCYSPQDADGSLLSELVQKYADGKSPNAGLLWVVKAQSAKLVPSAVALVSKRQLTGKHDGPVDL